VSPIAFAPAVSAGVRKAKRKQKAAKKDSSKVSKKRKQ